jgi:hypothetical protein
VALLLLLAVRADQCTDAGACERQSTTHGRWRALKSFEERDTRSVCDVIWGFFYA